MTILNFQIETVGQVGLKPRFIYLDTNNTVAEVSAVGFLNNFVSSGNKISESEMAVVTTRVTPASKSVQVQLFNITYSAGNWSLTANSTPLSLADGQIFVGNSGGVATGVTMSGDATISNTGVLTIANLAITNAKVATAAAIAFSKLAALTSGNVLVGSAGNVATAVALSGDATLIASGALTIANDAITTVKILDDNVTLAKLAPGITPSSIVAIDGKYDFVGGSATIAINVPGVVAGDRVYAQIEGSSNAVSIQKVTPTADTITVLCSADPGASTIAYMVLRTAA